MSSAYEWPVSAERAMTSNSSAVYSRNNNGPSTEPETRRKHWRTIKTGVTYLLCATVHYITYKFITRPTCQFASESGALRWRQNDLNSSVLRRFPNVKNVSAERVWTSREFQTVGAATQNALDANAMVAGGCCNDLIHVSAVPMIPNDCSRRRSKMSWSTQLKAALRSTRPSRKYNIGRVYWLACSATR